MWPKATRAGSKYCLIRPTERRGIPRRPADNTMICRHGTGMKRPRNKRAITGYQANSFCLADGGFTLLEILLAFFIFSILFITIFASYSSSFKTIDSTEGRMELYRKAAITLEKISEDLQASYISVLPQNSFGQPAGYTHFLGEDAEFNGKDADTLSFFSRVPPLFSKDDEASSGQLISYSVIEDSENDGLVLLRSENPEFTDETETRQGLVLSDGLQAINFTYFDDEGEEHESWDSESEEFHGRLPRRVLVALEFVNDENPEVPLKVMTSVAVLVNHVPQP
jgi:general secretion pathway protein J